MPGSLEMDMAGLMELVGDPMAFCNGKYAVAQQFNPKAPMIKTNVMGVPSVILFSHDLVKQSQGYELRGQTKRVIHPIIAKAIGRNVQDLDGGSWHMEWRKGINPAFKPLDIDKLTPIVQDMAQRVVLEGIAKLNRDTGDSVRLYTAAQRFAFNISAKFVLGPYITEQEMDYAFQKWGEYNYMVYPEAMQDIECKDPRSLMSRAMRGKDALRVFLVDKYLEAEQLVADGTWSEKWGDEQCLMRFYLENKCSMGDMLPDGKPPYTLYDRIDELLSFVWVAYDTTSTSLTNVVYAAHTHPEETRKVREAIMAHPKLSDPSTAFSIDLLKECTELECFVHEAQRMYGIVNGATRVVNDVEGLDFGGVTIPNGTGLLIPTQWLHQGPGSWTEPDEFKPSRFDKSKGQTKEERGDIGRYNSIPFHTGLHKCLGIHLALMELRLYTALLLRDWEFEVDESKMHEEGTINGRSLAGIPHYNVYLKLKRRHRSSQIAVEEEG